MHKETNHYARSQSYEAFMMRAFRRERNFSKGIDNSVYLQLYNIANGYSLTPKHYPKQIEKVRKFLLKGTDKVLKWKLTDDERAEVNYNTRQIMQTSDEEVLYQAINGLLNATQRFRDY